MQHMQNKTTTKTSQAKRQRQPLPEQNKNNIMFGFEYLDNADQQTNNFDERQFNILEMEQKSQNTNQIKVDQIVSQQQSDRNKDYIQIIITQDEDKKQIKQEAVQQIIDNFLCDQILIECQSLNASRCQIKNQQKQKVCQQKPVVETAKMETQQQMKKQHNIPIHQPIQQQNKYIQSNISEKSQQIPDIIIIQQLNKPIQVIQNNQQGQINKHCSIDISTNQTVNQQPYQTITIKIQPENSNQQTDQSQIQNIQAPKPIPISIPKPIQIPTASTANQTAKTNLHIIVITGIVILLLIMLLIITVWGLRALQQLLQSFVIVVFIYAIIALFYMERHMKNKINQDNNITTSI